MLDGLRPGDVDDRHRRGERDVRRDHRALADDDALREDRARADERTVLDDDGTRLRRLKHAADPDPAGEVHVGTDLGAGSDRRPRVHHRPRPNPRADVDEARHEHDALREEGPVARDPRRDDANAPSRVVALHGDLVEEGEPADLHRLDLAQPEVEKDRLLRPLVDGPFAVPSFGDAHFAAVEEADRGLDGLGIELVALPEVVDALRNVHQRASSPIRPLRKPASVSYAWTRAATSTCSSRRCA